MVIKLDKAVSLAIRQRDSGGCEREVKHARRHPAEVLVTVHRGQAEGVLKLLEPPELSHLAAVAEHLAELGGNGRRVNQRPVQVECKDHTAGHRASPDDLSLFVRPAPLLTHGTIVPYHSG